MLDVRRKEAELNQTKPGIISRIKRFAAKPFSSSLRHEGQSIEEDIQSRRDEIDELLSAALLVLASPIFLALGRYSRGRYDLVIMTVVAIIFTLYVARSVLRIRRRIKNDLVGLSGERFVGQFLEEKRGAGYKVVHALKYWGGDVDHVLVGPKGIFAIETKTRTPREGFQPEVKFDGKTVSVNGFRSDRDPVAQVERAAKWIKELIVAKSGKVVSVRPVLWYPGASVSFVSGADIWVINERLIDNFLQHEKEFLSPADVEEFYAVLCGAARAPSNGDLLGKMND